MTKELLKFEEIIEAMKDDVAFIDAHLFMHQHYCVVNDVPLGDDFHDVSKRVIAVMMELINLV